MDAVADEVVYRKETKEMESYLAVELPVLATLESTKPDLEEKMAVGGLREV